MSEYQFMQAYRAFAKAKRCTVSEFILLLDEDMEPYAEELLRFFFSCAVASLENSNGKRFYVNINPSRIPIYSKWREWMTDKPWLMSETAFSAAYSIFLQHTRCTEGGFSKHLPYEHRKKAGALLEYYAANGYASITHKATGERVYDPVPQNAPPDWGKWQHTGGKPTPRASHYTHPRESTPKAYGAKGDGVTDDTAAIQRLLDASSPNRKLDFSSAYDIFARQTDGVTAREFERLLPVSQRGSASSWLSQYESGGHAKRAGTRGGPGLRQQRVYVPVPGVSPPIKRRRTVKKPITPGGDIHAELQELRAWKADALAKHPELGASPEILKARQYIADALQRHNINADSWIRGEFDESATMEAILSAMRGDLD